ncbi:MAG: ferrous iron transport protein B, partial [Myxococcota bacterium]
GQTRLDDGSAARILDLPGTYSLSPRSDDEVVAVRGVLGTLPFGAPSLVVVVVDATNLARNLYLLSQLRELRCPLLVALTMMDVLEQDGLSLDVTTLEQRLGVPVVGSARGQRRDSDGVKAAISKALRLPLPRPLPPPPLPSLADVPQQDLRDTGTALQHVLGGAHPSEALALWASATHAMGTSTRVGIPEALASRLDGIARQEGLLQKLVEERHARAAEFARDVVRDERPVAGALRSVQLTDRIDRVLLHRVGGPACLLLLFGALFQALFAWSSPLMDVIEAAVGLVSEEVGARLPTEMPLLRSLLLDGVLAGVGNVVVFVPQIAILFLFLGLLEDSGYLARAAFLLDRVMARVGLHGRAFVPLLSGFACAVPAILATRTIESTKDRLVTILVTPLVSCSARLPVYALIIATVFSTTPPLFGFLHAGVVIMVAMYGLSLTAAILMAALFKRTLLKSPTPPLVLELPPYRLPRLPDVLSHVLGRVRIFLVEAGTVILAITVVLWGLFTFPRPATLAEEREQAIADIAQQGLNEDDAEQARAQIEAQLRQRSLEESAAGQLGHLLEPLILPLGFDWKIGVGLVASFAAREVLVSTLGLVYGLGEGSDEESMPLREAMRADVHHLTGSPLYTPRTGLALLVFFVLAMQCMSTLAVVKRETRSWRWPLFQFAYMTALAYGGAFVVYQVGGLLGFA